MTAAWSLSQPGLAKACVHGECIRPSLTQTALKKSSTGTHLITSQELEGMRATHRVRRRGNPELNQELPRERGYCRLNLVAPNCTKANLQIGRARRLFWCKMQVTETKWLIEIPSQKRAFMQKKSNLLLPFQRKRG